MLLSTRIQGPSQLGRNIRRRGRREREAVRLDDVIDRVRYEAL